MKKKLILLAVVVMTGLAAVIAGCKKTDKQENNANSTVSTEQQECGLCKVSYNDVSDEEKDMVMKYLASLAEKENGNEYEIIGSISTFNDTVSLISYCMRQIDSESNYLVVTMDDVTGTVIYNLPTTISSTTSSNYIVEVKKNGEDYFGASFALSLSDSTFQSLEGPVCYGPTLGDDVIDCFVTAYMACLSDPECDELCGYAPEYCIPAILLACAIHHLKGGAADS